MPWAPAAAAAAFKPAPACVLCSQVVPGSPPTARPTPSPSAGGKIIVMTEYDVWEARRAAYEQRGQAHFHPEAKRAISKAMKGRWG